MTRRHVMLDLETWGTRPGAALRSIGAVVFGLGSGLGAEFYRNIDKQSCLDVGLFVEPATERWWAEQTQQARASLAADARPLEEVVADFAAWFVSVGGEFLWSQGANFDGPLWEAATRAVKRDPPWKFFNARDTRTVYHICGFDPHSVPRRGIAHNALDDAKHQARLIQAALAAAAKRFERIAGALS